MGTEINDTLFYWTNFYLCSVFNPNSIDVNLNNKKFNNEGYRLIYNIENNNTPEIIKISNICLVDTFLNKIFYDLNKNAYYSINNLITEVFTEPLKYLDLSKDIKILYNDISLINELSNNYILIKNREICDKDKNFDIDITIKTPITVKIEIDLRINEFPLPTDYEKLIENKISNKSLMRKFYSRFLSKNGYIITIDDFFNTIYEFYEKNIVFNMKEFYNNILSVDNFEYDIKFYHWNKYEVDFSFIITGTFEKIYKLLILIHYLYDRYTLEKN